MQRIEWIDWGFVLVLALVILVAFGVAQCTQVDTSVDDTTTPVLVPEATEPVPEPTQPETLPDTGGPVYGMISAS